MSVKLGLKYLPSLKLSDYEKEESELLEEVIELLNDNLQREKEVCLYGPHRDDLGFNVNDMDAQTYGSQGQQELLSIKLAEIELMNIEVGVSILLLDDVLSELDDSRQTHLLSTINIKYRHL